MHRTFKNNGEVDSYYIEGNHPPIVSNEMWEKVQEELVKRAEEKEMLKEIEISIRIDIL